MVARVLRDRESISFKDVLQVETTFPENTCLSFNMWEYTENLFTERSISSTEIETVFEHYLELWTTLWTSSEK